MRSHHVVQGGGTLTATGLKKSYGKRVILEKTSIQIGPHDRVGIVGPNGIGKSTLLKVLAGVESVEQGRVDRAPPSLRVGYLAQEPDTRPAETLIGYLARRTGVGAAEAEVDRMQAALAGDESLAEAYTEALERFLALGGDDLRPRAEMVLADLGLPADRLEVSLTDLSAGQQARAQLAAILLSRFDVLLLDEPTNNLDFAGLDRLERFVAGLAGGVAVVSHDRAFLDRTVTRIYELRDDDLTGTDYAGGWSDYVQAREIALRRQREAHERYTSEKGRLTERMQRQREWAAKGVRNLRREKLKGGTPKMALNAKINRTEKQASKVRATEKAIERLDKVDKPWEPWRLQLRIEPRTRSGEIVSRMQGAVVRRGTFTLGPVDLEVGVGERVAILGPNGSGKTTLLRAMLGTLPLQAGRRYLGPGVVVGEMDQGRTSFEGETSLLDAFVEESGILPGAARTLLAKFSLGAGHVDRPGWSLSPGERSRAVLATLMARGVNCLVLDEPTNHLDLPAIEQLEQVLDDFPGTVLLVTHDRWLLDRVRLDRTVELEGR